MAARRKHNTKPEALVARSPGATVLRALRDWIRDGRLPRGERLPQQEALAAQFHVSRTVVRGAIRQLEEEGLVLAGPRRQRLIAGSVAAASPATSTVLAQAVGVLTDNPDSSPLGEAAVTGWSVFVQKGLVAALRRRGFNVLMLDPERVDAGQVAQLAAGGLRGVVYCAFAGPAEKHAATLAALQAAGVSGVVYNRAPEFAAFDVVDADHALGCALLTRWLIDRGCRRILRLWPTVLDGEFLPVWLQERNRGYADALREAGLATLPPVELPSSGGGSWPDTLKKFQYNANLMLGYLKEALEGPRGADAILIASDGMVPSVAAACRRLGKEPNREVLLAGYDFYWAECPERRFELTPPLVTIDKQNVLAGEMLVELLEQRLAGELPPAPQCRLVPPRLVLSTELLA